MKRGIYVAFDQLHRNYGALKNANPKNDLIILVESQRMLASKKWHFQRLWFMISAARHFAESLKAEGFEVVYLKAANTKAGIESAMANHGLTDVIAAKPNSYRLSENLQSIVTFLENDFFLTSQVEFTNWAASQKSLLMENFYRLQRKKLNILMDGEKPVGGAWNFDKENRLTPPKGYQFPNYLEHQKDKLDLEVETELSNSKLELWGAKPNSTWGTTRKAALAQLNYFLDNHFQNFGPYEDAMLGENWALHHSLLSPYLNIGLIHASEVIEAVRNRYQKGDVPLAS